jgi:hypothetical protein
MDATLIYKILTIVVMAGFLPLCALTYYNYRLGQRKLEIERILKILEITSDYKNIYTFDIGRRHYAISVLFATSVAIVGLCSLFLSAELKLGQEPNILLGKVLVADMKGEYDKATLQRYQHGALMAFGVGFFGAYLWGLQNIIRRYSMNDLLPAAFFRFGLRMIFSSVVALLIYHAVGGFNGEYGSADKRANELLLPTSDGLLLLLVFMVGMFPQRGINWMVAKINISDTDKHPTVEPLPLEMIEGMTSYDKERLEELGIDSCYDLSVADFIPLLLKTPYGSRELINWLLQAKLCVRFGSSVGELRKQGFKTIADLEGMDETFMEQLVRDSSLSLTSLKRATHATVSDHNITRLKRAAESLGKYWEGEPDVLSMNDDTEF